MTDRTCTCRLTEREQITNPQCPDHGNAEMARRGGRTATAYLQRKLDAGEQLSDQEIRQWLDSMTPEELGVVETLLETVGDDEEVNHG